MSIDQTNVIDFIGVDKRSGKTIITISDHLMWGGEQNWHKEHLVFLEKKINTYLQFIESGQLLEDYPNAKGKKIVIEIRGKYPLDDNAQVFYEKAKKVISEAGFELNFELFQDK